MLPFFLPIICDQFSNTHASSSSSNTSIYTQCAKSTRASSLLTFLTRRSHSLSFSVNLYYSCVLPSVSHSSQLKQAVPAALLLKSFTIQLAWYLASAFVFLSFFLFLFFFFFFLQQLHQSTITTLNSLPPTHLLLHFPIHHPRHTRSHRNTLRAAASSCLYYILCTVRYMHVSIRDRLASWTARQPVTAIMFFALSRRRSFVLVSA
ncbi:uncharacterized protein J3D65DRAFT_251739 [Phyllosticta citribraziliensis]|uniref:Uncharacterized protein n=1 Tax=Phyllosticta citribraziliensis TaxID=989973 RepID=A0ABR1LZV8_9PEZI